MFKLTVNLSLSEAQNEFQPLEQANDPEGWHAEFAREISYPWVQFTYDGLYDQDGASMGVHFSSGDGFWHFEDRIYTDVVISIEEA